MNIKIKRNEKVLITIYLFLIIILGLGITYSFFTMASRAKEDSTKVYAGWLDIDYNEGNTIVTDSLFPMHEPSFNETRNIYKKKFSVNSKGTLEQNVSISFEVSKNEFSTNSIKYSLYNYNGTKLSSGYVNNGLVTLVDNQYFKENETRDYILIIWLEENSKDQTKEQGKMLSGTIVVQSKQYGF